MKVWAHWPFRVWSDGYINHGGSQGEELSHWVRSSLKWSFHGATIWSPSLLPQEEGPCSWTKKVWTGYRAGSVWFTISCTWSCSHQRKSSNQTILQVAQHLSYYHPVQHWRCLQYSHMGENIWNSGCCFLKVHYRGPLSLNRAEWKHRMDDNSHNPSPLLCLLGLSRFEAQCYLEGWGFCTSRGDGSSTRPSPSLMFPVFDGTTSRYWDVLMQDATSSWVIPFPPFTAVTGMITSKRAGRLSLYSPPKCASEVLRCGQECSSITTATERVNCLSAQLWYVEWE